MTTWKKPDYQAGPVRKVALLAVDERGVVRQIFEGQFVTQFKQHGQEAFQTVDILSLPEIKADKETAAARLRENGADSILIVRLVDAATQTTSVRQNAERYSPMTTGIESYGWYNYYTVAYADMSVVQHGTKQKVYLDTSLYDLQSGQRLWSAFTRTVLKDNMDRLEEVRPLVATVMTAMRADGFVR